MGASVATRRCYGLGKLTKRSSSPLRSLTAESNVLTSDPSRVMNTPWHKYLDYSTISLYTGLINRPLTPVRPDPVKSAYLLPLTPRLTVSARDSKSRDKMYFLSLGLLPRSLKRHTI